MKVISKITRVSTPDETDCEIKQTLTFKLSFLEWWVSRNKGFFITIHSDYGKAKCTNIGEIKEYNVKI